MKVNILLLLFGLFFGGMATAQVKIGDNPQNIGAASVLELESSTRALVITRVSTTQMNSIVPLEGAMVYNTDVQCIHYYNGAQWLNLCDALNNSINITLTDNGDGTYTFTDAQDNVTQIPVRNQSLTVEDGNLVLTEGDGNVHSVALSNLSAQTFTTEAIVNAFPNTVVITPDETGTNFNFEVGLIDGANIQSGSVRQVNLANNSVGKAQLADNSVGATEIYNDSVTAAKINIDVAGAGLRQAANGALEVDVTDIEGDGDLSSNNGALVITGDPEDALLADIGLEVIVDSVTIGIDPITGLEVMDNGITNVQMADLSIGTAELINDAVTLPKLANGTTNGQIMQWNGTDWVLQLEGDGIVGNEVVNATTSGGLLRSGSGTATDPYTLGVANNGIGTGQLNNDAVTLPKLADGTTNGQVMQWNGTEWVLQLPSALAVTEVDGIVGNEVVDATTSGGLIRSGSGTATEPYTLGVANNGIGTNQLANDAVTLPKLANGTTIGQIMQWDGTDWVLQLEGDGIVGNEVREATTNGGLIRSGSGTATEPFTLGVNTGIGLVNNTTNGQLDLFHGTANQILRTDATGEFPEWATIPTVVAAGKVNADGTTTKIMGATVDPTHIADSGQYIVNYTPPLNNADYIIQLTVFNGTPGFSIQVTAQNAADFTVQISDIAGNPVDAAWYFTVTDF